LHHIFEALVKILAPILTFTADEAWTFATARTEYADDSVHLRDWPLAPAEWTDNALEADFADLLRARALVNEMIEPHRAAGRLGKSLDAAVTLEGAADDRELAVLLRHEEFLPELFIVSVVTVESTPAAGALTVGVRPAMELGHTRCPRCWRSVPALVPTPDGAVCPRCAAALNH
jgi:isoleucyl-tRNA synthetase